MQLEDLTGPSNALAPHYRRFRVDQRLLLTGHSHQAWPDVAERGLQRCFADAAEHVDDKWARAEERAERVRRGFARLLDDPDGDYALGASTHDLVVRLLSALPLRARPRIVTTDGEFHSLRRQLARLEEERVEVVRVPAHPAADVGERLAAAVDDRTAAVMASCVFFASAHLAGPLRPAADACARHGAVLLVDAYHALDVVPYSLREQGLGDAFVVGGGYKYCQLGEGNGFLRVPPGCSLRPVVTGWFAEFGELQAPASPGAVRYPAGPGRFAGSTYDPVSHYRAAEVFAFFERQGLTPALLRQVSQHQIARLARGFDALDLPPAVIDRDRTVPLSRLGGFLALRAPAAGALSRALRERGVHTDARGEVLRLGPAPYLSDGQLEQSIAQLGEAVSARSSA